ncbi:MAG TPA: GlxA family transcriptional regulator [Phenylobacterium sp.]
MLVAILVPAARPLLVEIAAIADAFFEANVQSGQDHYRVRLISEHREPIRTSSGLTILPDATLDEVGEPIDTLMVPPAHGVPDPPSPAVTEWLRAQTPLARRYGSVCTGAFILGAAGLLSGRHVTTHWQYARDLAAQYPAAVVEPDRIFVRDGPLFTSAGVTAAFDLVLSLIEEDLGRDVALAVGRYLVMYLKRPGGQSQFSAQLAAQFVAREPIQRVLQWIRDHLRKDLSVSQLAREAGMSQRSFARAFVQETHVTPAQFVELARIEEAQGLLEGTRLPVQRVALDSGFSGTQAMRKAFSRRLDITPSEYRERFRTTGETGPPGAA